MAKFLSVFAALTFVYGCTAQQPAPAQNSAQPASNAAASSETDDKDPHVILWRIAKQCKENLAKNPGCRAYVNDGDQEYAIIKDNSPVKPQAYLIIPIARATGIEDSQVLAPPLSKLWESAWLWSAESRHAGVAHRNGNQLVDGPKPESAAPSHFLCASGSHRRAFESRHSLRSAESHHDDISVRPQYIPRRQS